MLVVRGAGPVGYPGSAEVVNMTPPAALVEDGVAHAALHGRWPAERHIRQPVDPERVARIGRRRQSGDPPDRRSGEGGSAQPPRGCAAVSDEEIERPRGRTEPPALRNDSPWQELYRAHVGQLETGACLDFAVPYRDLRKVVPRHSH